MARQIADVTQTSTGTLSGGAVATTPSPRGDISTAFASQFGFGHKRQKRRMMTDAQMKRVFMVALLADQQIKRKRAA